MQNILISVGYDSTFFDIKEFYDVYLDLIDYQAISLYIFLLNFNNVTIPLDVLLKKTNITNEEIFTAIRAKLEKFNLLITRKSLNENKLQFILLKHKCFSDLINEKKTNDLIIKTLPQIRYDELKFKYSATIDSYIMNNSVECCAYEQDDIIENNINFEQITKDICKTKNDFIHIDENAKACISKHFCESEKNDINNVIINSMFNKTVNNDYLYKNIEIKKCDINIKRLNYSDYFSIKDEEINTIISDYTDISPFTFYEKICCNDKPNDFDKIIDNAISKKIPINTINVCIDFTLQKCKKFNLTYFKKLLNTWCASNFSTCKQMINHLIYRNNEVTNDVISSKF